jgi:catechol 2,3-dioxygenase-like lactoylglutathione lyase family enzyme
VEPRLDVITLVVADLERALAFYCDLGFKSKGIIGTEWTDEVTGANGALAMFKLDGGLLLNLYPRADLAKDAAIPGAGPHSEGSASHNSFVAAPRRTSCWRRRRQRGLRSHRPTTDPGGSTPATSVILMATSGRSSSIRTELHRRAAGLPAQRRLGQCSA